LVDAHSLGVAGTALTLTTAISQDIAATQTMKAFPTPAVIPGPWSPQFDKAVIHPVFPELPLNLAIFRGN